MANFYNSKLAKQLTPDELGLYRDRAAARFADKAGYGYNPGSIAANPMSQPAVAEGGPLVLRNAGQLAVREGQQLATQGGRQLATTAAQGGRIVGPSGAARLGMGTVGAALVAAPGMDEEAHPYVAPFVNTAKDFTGYTMQGAAAKPGLWGTAAGMAVGAYNAGKNIAHKFQEAGEAVSDMARSQMGLQRSTNMLADRAALHPENAQLQSDVAAANQQLNAGRAAYGDITSGPLGSMYAGYAKAGESQQNALHSANQLADFRRNNPAAAARMDAESGAAPAAPAIHNGPVPNTLPMDNRPVPLVSGANSTTPRPVTALNSTDSATSVPAQAPLLPHAAPAAPQGFQPPTAEELRQFRIQTGTNYDKNSVNDKLNLERMRVPQETLDSKQANAYRASHKAYRPGMYAAQ